jgi:peptide/nickel transport system permease protein
MTMPTYVLRRVALSFFLALGAALIVFFSIHLAPGDAVMAALGEAGMMTPAQVQVKRHELGLDRPLLAQCGDWIAHLARGDLGTSFVNSRPIARDLAAAFPRTLELVAAALAIGLLAGIPAGVYSATHQDRWLDYLVTGLSLAAVSIPSFVSGTLLLLLFGLTLRWLPVSGYVSLADDPLRHVQLLILPAVVLGLIMAAPVSRMTRATVLEVRQSDFVRTARAKGLPERLVLFGHTLKNALIPVVTLTGVEVGSLLGGTVIIEYVFTWPGMSTLLITAAERRDYPVVQGVVLATAFFFILVSLLVDLLNASFDPRIRQGGQ